MDFLGTINISSDNPYLSSVDGIVYNKGQSELLYYPEGKTGKSYTISSELVTKIGNNAFWTTVIFWNQL